MNKRLLRKLPIQEFREEWRRLANQLLNTDLEHFIAAEKVNQENEDILVLSIFEKSNIDKVSYRVYLTNDAYLTQDYTEEKCNWKTGALESIYQWHWSHRWYEKCVMLDEHSINTIIEFVGNEYIENPLKGVDKLQESIKQKRLNKKHQSIKDEIDKKMNLVKTLPADFEEWIKNSVPRYIYYEYKAKKKLDGYCTHCKTDVVVEGAKHNKEGVCPNCNSPIQYKSLGKSQKIQDIVNGAVIQNCNDYLVTRYFRVTKAYWNDYKNPRLQWMELSRDYIDEEGKLVCYEWKNFKQTNDMRWTECTGMFVYDFSSAILYTNNLDEELESTKWKYSAIKEYATYNRFKNIYIYSYLLKYIKYPALEYLVKIGLYNLTDSILGNHDYYYNDSMNLKGSNIFDVLGVNKEQLNRIKRLDASLREIVVIRESEKAGFKLSDEQVRYVIKELNISNVVEMAEYTTFTKIVNYLNKQYDLIEDKRSKSISNILHTWVDYKKDCKVLNYNLNDPHVLFPKNLYEAHQETISLIKAKKNEEYNIAIRGMHDKLSDMYKWKNSEYAVVVPRSYDDLIEEGNKLEHCVARNYGSKVVDGKSVILFLRKQEKIEEPLYTIEVDPENYEVVQYNGFGNKVKDEGIKNIIDRYVKERLTPLAKKMAV